ncbi:Phage protein (N4 Gp49/phage Sf6 gene 66) family [uncultured Caudovirales phage]|uniref:Phage protein (N4 Gp49/phage Sf6 gene 66) family n=1 Tax=uncultured Caudovirales phage TaxID=2100421 RepID=A0A6J5NQC4_9CAUD|nr:Phage protein (N4 Gp49/phage Sf6 gene 66) family [uncultured Caudovirales phage]
MTQYYIGSKQVLAWEQDRDGEPGYAVKYSDDYTSWSPKAVFEKAYLAQGHDPSRITPQLIEDFIVNEHYIVVGEAVASGATTAVLRGPVSGSLDLLTICVLTLRNGFTVTGESACVTPANFDAEIGRQIARRNAVEKVWPLLGFLLATARNGV